MTALDDFSGLGPSEEHRLLGLSAFFMRAGDLAQARQWLEAAEGRGLDPFAILLGKARLALLEGDGEAATACLEEARHQDPFDEDAADLLGQVLMQAGQNREALECFVDARILGGSTDPERERYYSGCISQLLRAGGVTPEERGQLERARAARFEELVLETEDAVSAEGSAPGQQPTEQEVAAPMAERPMRDVLSQVSPFSKVDDNELRLLECTMDRLRFAKGQVVFREGQPSEDLFVIESGGMVIQRDTPFGSQVLATIGANGLFGEMNFIDGRSRSADAVAAQDTVLLRIAHDSLRRIFEVEPNLAFVFLEQFWRGLSDKVREGNELMKVFFDEAGGNPPKAPDAAAAPAAVGAVSGRAAGASQEQKASVLSEKGLTGEDMRLLSEIAEAKTYDSGQAIFLEGDEGGTLHVVLDGRVRIEKHIPGVGQEALAILERGDFFGEMSIVEDAPRSASALGHDTHNTVLVISKDSITRLLQTRSAAAQAFLMILCRILSTRLREINDKIVQWRFMSGGF